MEKSVHSSLGVSIDKIKEMTGAREEKQIREDIAVEKAAQFLVDQSKATKEPKKEEDGEAKGTEEKPKAKRAVPRRKKKEE